MLPDSRSVLLINTLSFFLLITFNNLILFSVSHLFGSRVSILIYGKICVSSNEYNYPFIYGLLVIYFILRIFPLFVTTQRFQNIRLLFFNFCVFDLLYIILYNSFLNDKVFLSSEFIYQQLAGVLGNITIFPIIFVIISSFSLCEKAFKNILGKYSYWLSLSLGIILNYAIIFLLITLR